MNNDICVVTLYDDAMAELGELTSSIMRDYCTKYEYDFYAYPELLDPSASASWNKLDAIVSFLHSYKIVVWLDADVLIKSDKIGLEGTIFRPHAPMTISQDYNGICCGVMSFNRDADPTHEWIASMLATWKFLGPASNSTKHEQDTFKLMLNFPAIYQHIERIPEQYVTNPVSLSDMKSISLMHHYWTNGQPERIKDVTERIRNWKQTGIFTTPLGE